MSGITRPLFIVALVAAIAVGTATAQRSTGKATAPIIIVNTFLGWSVIGWVLALAWAFTVQEGPRPRGRRSTSDDNPF